MFRSNEEEIESRFGYLLIKVQSALKSNNVNARDVHQLLVTIFHRDDCIPNTTLEDIFTAVRRNNLWNYDHHSPLEKVVERFIPGSLKLITEYKEHLSGFYTTTKLIDYMMSKVNVEDEAEMDSNNLALTKEHYRKLKVRLNIGRKISEVSMIYVRDLWISFATEFDIPSLTAIIDKILEGSLEIIWLILPHEAEMIAISAQKSTLFFRKHNILYVAIDDQVIYSAQL